ncbi:hypothetical protein [Hyunsoonleella ulvae]|uniref:hypothetical protein n=1 Tax=Hyunsoonleella ulvae TaxID=2799948 RepID=UPI00193A58AB|nr:hypothetical protein [Hyunsoonleella ulvae]
MKIKNYFNFLFLIFLISLLSSCGSLVKSLALKSYTVEKGAIPPDFGKDNSTLICVLTGKNSRDKYLKKHVEKIYKGKYVFVLSGDMPAFNNKSNEYSDIEKYRYVFDFKRNYRTTFTPNPVSNRTDVGSVPLSNYFIVDRKYNKTYNSGGESGYFSKLIEAYMINLEKQRLKNQLQ